MYLDLSKHYRKKTPTYPLAVVTLKVIYKFIIDYTLAGIA